MNRKPTEGQIVSAIVIVIMLMILEPMLYLLNGFIAGWITKIVLGKFVVSTLNMMTGMKFTPDQLPYIGAALGWISMFFKGKALTEGIIKDRNKGCGCGNH